MKKFLTLAVAAAVLSATVSALTFKVDGYARAGLTSTLNTKNKDGDKEAKTVSTKQWLAGDYFGGGSRLRLNGDILSDDGTAGVKFRFQYTGSFEDFDITKDEVKYVYAWGKGFEGKVIAGAGKSGTNTSLQTVGKDSALSTEKQVFLQDTHQLKVLHFWQQL